MVLPPQDSGGGPSGHHPAEIAGPGEVAEKRGQQGLLRGARCQCLWQTHLTTSTPALRRVRAAHGHTLAALHWPFPAPVFTSSHVSPQVESPGEGRPEAAMLRAPFQLGSGERPMRPTLPLCLPCSPPPRPTFFCRAPADLSFSYPTVGGNRSQQQVASEASAG